ncbi:MAG: glycosyltransferase family 4 protein [bacterium]
MKKILFIAHDLYPPLRGAEKSSLTLLEHLSEEGFDTYAFCIEKNRSRKVEKNGVTVNTFSELLSLTKSIETLLPDVIFTQFDLAPFAVSIAKRLNIPVVLFVHGMDYFCHVPLYAEICDRNCKNCNYYNLYETTLVRNREMLQQADAIISNSEYTRQVLKEFTNMDSEVIYPFINYDEIICEEIFVPQKYITMYQPEVRKGILTFCEIARLMPEEQFLTVGHGIKLKLPNVRYMGYTPPKYFYSTTKLLVVPSVIGETFGMIIVEALLNGIPVVAGRIGGIPEAAGPGAILIDDFLNPDKWVKEIKRVLNDENLRRELVEDGKIYIKTHFNPKKEFQKLRAVISKVGISCKV